MANSDKDLQPAGLSPPAMTDIETKHDIDLIEKVDRDALPEDTIMMSPFEDMNIRKTWSTFRKCALVCLFATVSAAAE